MRSPIIVSNKKYVALKPKPIGPTKPTPVIIMSNAAFALTLQSMIVKNIIKIYTNCNPCASITRSFHIFKVTANIIAHRFGND